MYNIACGYCRYNPPVIMDGNRKACFKLAVSELPKSSKTEVEVKDMTELWSNVTDDVRSCGYTKNNKHIGLIMPDYTWTSWVVPSFAA